MLLLTLRGTPTLYYGDEIGMRDVAIAPDAIQDPQGKNVGLSRDPGRTPMQWNATRCAGFSSGLPWLPLSHDYEHRNVEVEAADADSILLLYHRLIQLRRQEPALVLGTYRPVVAQGDLIAYLREHGDQRWLVALNLGPGPNQLALEALGSGGEIVIATERAREHERLTDRLVLAGDDGVVVRLS
jgi:alpha-glucosidase